MELNPTELDTLYSNSYSLKIKLDMVLRTNIIDNES